MKLYCAVEFFSVIEVSKLFTIKVENNSQTVDDPSLVQSATEVLASICNLDCVPTIMTTFTIYTI